jgi:hypothetical protein
MNKLSRLITQRPVISGTAIAVLLVVALTGCGGSSVASAPASGQNAAHAAASQSTAGEAKVPKYVASENARTDVVANACRRDGSQGWLLSGTAINPSTSLRGYSIVVDFVTRKGDTVLDTKIVSVQSVAPKASARWSAIGAAGADEVTCVIRQALVTHT